MKKSVTFLVILSICLSGNVFAYNLTDADNQQIQAMIKQKENEIMQSHDLQARTIVMQKLIDSKTDTPNNRQNYILDEVHFQLGLKNNILKAGNVYCKIGEIKLIDNVEKSITDYGMKLVGVNMLCVNASRTNIANSLGFVALDLNSGGNDPIYTSFTQSGIIVGNVQSHFFTDKTLQSPEFPQGTFKPLEKKSGWLIFQINDRATRISFGILQSLNSAFGVMNANITRKDQKYMSDAALLCRKYESSNYSSADCLLATTGTFKMGVPKSFVIDAIGGKQESCGTAKSDSKIGTTESYCFKDASKFLKGQTYYYFLNNKLINTTSVKL